MTTALASRLMPCWRVPVSGVFRRATAEHDDPDGPGVSLAAVITADTADDARGRAIHLYPDSLIGAPELIHGPGGHAEGRRGWYRG